MLKNRIIKHEKENIVIVKKCFQSHVNVRKPDGYLPDGFLRNCCCFLRLLENILEKDCIRHCRTES